MTDKKKAGSSVMTSFQDWPMSDWQKQGRVSNDFFSQFLEVSACLARSQLLGETLRTKSEYCMIASKRPLEWCHLIHFFIIDCNYFEVNIWLQVAWSIVPLFKVSSLNLRLGTTCTILEALTKWRSLFQVEILRINFWQEIPIVILWKCTNCGVRRLNRGIKRLLFEGQRHKSSRLSISPDIKLLKSHKGQIFTGQVKPALGCGGCSVIGKSVLPSHFCTVYPRPIQIKTMLKHYF